VSLDSVIAEHARRTLRAQRARRQEDLILPFEGPGREFLQVPGKGAARWCDLSSRAPSGSREGDCAGFRVRGGRGRPLSRKPIPGSFNLCVWCSWFALIDSGLLGPEAGCGLHGTLPLPAIAKAIARMIPFQPSGCRIIFCRAQLPPLHAPRSFSRTLLCRDSISRPQSPWNPWPPLGPFLAHVHQWAIQWARGQGPLVPSALPTLPLVPAKGVPARGPIKAHSAGPIWIWAPKPPRAFIRGLGFPGFWSFGFGNDFSKRRI